MKTETHYSLYDVCDRGERSFLFLIKKTVYKLNI